MISFRQAVKGTKLTATVAAFGYFCKNVTPNWLLLTMLKTVSSTVFRMWDLWDLGGGGAGGRKLGISHGMASCCCS